MTAAPRRWAAELLYVWFHELGPVQWWGGSDAVDTMLRRRFGKELRALSPRPSDEFLMDPLTARAAILLFDQIPRNIHRGSAQAFATDGMARQLTRGVIARQWDSGLSAREKPFVYMPLMHSEAIADQRDSLAIFATRAPFNLGFARSHHRMIARFGRFPHRNAVLGRTSSAAEKAAVAAGFAW